MPTYPCAFTHPNLLCAAALDQADQLASFSNHGSVSVDVGAPGTNIRSAWHASYATLTDPLTSGWLGSSSNAGGWFYSAYATYDVLANPGTFPDELYRHSTDDRAYKSFDLTGAAVASLEFAAWGNVAAGDRFSVGCSSSTADPFAGAGVTLLDVDGAGAGADAAFVSLDLTGCAGGLASIGFRLTTDASIADQGLAIGHFQITTDHLSTTRYAIQNGTSMATPLVAGIAALLRARNPLYTATDVVAALEAAGRPVPALAGKTTTGRAVDAMSTLAHVRPPTGLTATIE